MNRYETTFQTWNKIASAYEDKFMDLDLYNETYDTFCNLIDKSKTKIFEIGCGPGNITRYLLNKRPDFEMEATDIAPYMVKLAKVNNPSADCKIMDCRKIDLLTKTFDGVMCGFCMPYLSKKDSAKLIKDCANRLSKDGIFYLSVIEGDYGKSGYETGRTGDQIYVYYYQEKFIKDELIKNNFEVVTLNRIVYPITNEKFQTHLILISRKLEIQ